MLEESVGCRSDRPRRGPRTGRGLQAELPSSTGPFGQQRERAFVVGTNADEYRLFLIPTGLINFINEDFLGAAIAACGLPVPETLTAYRATRPAASQGELLEAVLTDWIYRLPAVRLAEAHTPRSGRT